MRTTPQTTPATMPPIAAEEPEFEEVGVADALPLDDASDAFYHQPLYLEVIGDLACYC